MAFYISKWVRECRVETVELYTWKSKDSNLGISVSEGSFMVPRETPSSSPGTMLPLSGDAFGTGMRCRWEAISVSLDDRVLFPLMNTSVWESEWGRERCTWEAARVGWNISLTAVAMVIPLLTSHHSLKRENLILEFGLDRIGFWSSQVAYIWGGDEPFQLHHFHVVSTEKKFLTK